MSVSMLVGLLVSFVAFAGLSNALYDKKSGVITLDNSNFDMVGQDPHEVAMVEFFAPWCGHCKQLAPEYIKLAKSVKNLVKVYAIDASDDKNKGIAQQFGIRGFPTLKVFAGTNPAQDYNGERSAEGMKKQLLSMLPNFAQKVSEKSIDKFLESNLASPRALVISRKPTVSATVKRLSALFDGHIVFGAVTKKSAKDVGNKFDISVEKTVLLVFPPQETSPVMYGGNLGSFREIQAFLGGYAPGLELDEDALPKLLDESCFQEKCQKKGLCVILIRGGNEADNANAHSILKNIEDTSDDASLFAFSQIDGIANREWIVATFGDRMTPEYANIVVLAPIKKRYAQYVGSFAQASVSGFISGILRGSTRTTPIAGEDMPPLSTETEHCKPKPKKKAKKSRSSQSGSGSGSNAGAGGDDWQRATPGHGSKYIYELTSSNFDELILSSNQSAVIEFFAPWCGHCQQFAPEFARAANNLKGMVLFGGVDCNEDSNRPLCGQYGIEGFPTIKMFPVGSERKRKNGAKTYQQERSHKALEREATNTLYSVKIPLLVNEGDYNTFLQDQSNAKILLFSDKSKPPTLLRALASKFSNVAFAMVSSNQKQLIEGAGLTIEKYPEIRGFALGSGTGDKYNGEKTFDALTKFLDELLVAHADTPKQDAQDAAKKEL